ncbi:MAG: TlpA family protein disulfide reductase [Bacteroidetes bacterium]|nr:TlpA family protein disulfide reductase [Bacteroidota bacterium]
MLVKRNGTKIILCFAFVFCSSCQSLNQNQVAIGKPADELNSTIQNILSVPEPPYFSHLVGKTIPSFCVHSLEGIKFDSESLIGKPMVLNFWFIGCPNCYEEIPDLNLIHEDSKKGDFVFISFCKDGKLKLTESFEKTIDNGLKRKATKKTTQTMFYDVVPDSENIISELNINAFPVTLTVGRDGKVSKVILYTKLAQFPDEMVTYRLISAEIQRMLKMPE